MLVYVLNMLKISSIFCFWEENEKLIWKMLSLVYVKMFFCVMIYYERLNRYVLLNRLIWGSSCVLYFFIW